MIPRDNSFRLKRNANPQLQHSAKGTGDRRVDPSYAFESPVTVREPSSPSPLASSPVQRYARYHPAAVAQQQGYNEARERYDTGSGGAPSYHHPSKPSAYGLPGHANYDAYTTPAPAGVVGYEYDERDARSRYAPPPRDARFAQHPMHEAQMHAFAPGRDARDTRFQPLPRNESHHVRDYSLDERYDYGYDYEYQYGARHMPHRDNHAGRGVVGKSRVEGGRSGSGAASRGLYRGALAPSPLPRSLPSSQGSYASSAHAASASTTSGGGVCGTDEKQKLKASMELMEDVAKGREEQAAERLRRGANPDFADYDRRTPLHVAAANGNLAIVQLLLRHGASPDVVDRRGTRPIDEASRAGFVAIIDALRTRSRPVEGSLCKERREGLELLEHAARGALPLVREKIRAGTDASFADYDRRTALHLAACEGHVAIVTLLLNNGADMHSKDRFGRTPVDDALANGRLEVLQTLAKYGAQLPSYVLDECFTPEFQRNMRLIDACARGKMGNAQKCLRDGADALFADYDARTALHLACAEGHLNIVKLLLASGADPTAEDRWGCTPFDEVKKYGHDDIAKLLDEHLMESIKAHRKSE